MESGRLRPGKLRGTGVGVALLIGILALAAVPAQAKAASPVLEFATASPFPVGFTAKGGQVTAAMTGFDTVVHCSGSEGAGVITGPRSTSSQYAFTGCETQTGSEGGRACRSVGANPNEIRSETVEADLVFIDQARHEVGVVLNPHGGVYLEFECAGEPVKATGSFLSPVGPINQLTTDFTATLTRSGSTQTPSEYETLSGEKLKAIPMGERGMLPPAATAVELGFGIHTSAPITVRAVTAAEVEAKQRADEAAAAAAKKRQEEEATARRRQEEEAARKRQEEERARAKKRAQHLSKALRQCRKLKSHAKRRRCVNRARRKYGAPVAHATAHR